MSKLEDIIANVFHPEEFTSQTAYQEFMRDVNIFCGEFKEALKKEIGKEYEQGFIRTAIDTAYLRLKGDTVI